MGNGLTGGPAWVEKFTAEQMKQARDRAPGQTFNPNNWDHWLRAFDYLSWPTIPFPTDAQTNVTIPRVPPAVSNNIESTPRTEGHTPDCECPKCTPDLWK